MFRSPTRAGSSDLGNNREETSSQINDQTLSCPGVISNSNPQSHNTEISAVSLKLPQFWTSCPEAWFIHAEMQFVTKGITQSRTKYEHIVTALPQEVIVTVLDVIKSPISENPYNHLKNILIERHSLSENKKLDKILSDSEIGDRRPSEFYRSLA